ncbi:acyl carrier protein [Crocosphaera sp. XPORK-15E]|uniref:acyl carrier protein n=1 Tax=Crocosphaera sp. XPORK-15E TaxID=3110247 RepID=UPI002B20B0D7|nr:acyl carrier protein [Crocosphaera sp. XPORK-15E]MEA5535105.1 acyl carrier protein [Crocosphaera sp. XPORK-15E]
MQLQSSSLKLDNPTTAPTPVEAVQNWLIKQLAEQLSLDPTTIKVGEPLTRYGLDSIDAVTLVGDLEDWLDLDLPDTLFWDHSTIEKAAQYLEENYELADALEKIDTEAAETPVNKTPENNTEKKGWGNLFAKFK